MASVICQIRRSRRLEELAHRCDQCRRQWRNETVLFAAQLNGQLCFTFLGGLLCRYRLHAFLHQENYASICPKVQCADSAGGGAPLPPFGSQVKLLLNPMFHRSIVKEAP
jgi:hypothetical protein